MDFKEILQQASYRIANKINFDENPQRRTQLAKKIQTLFSNGFDEILLRQQEIKFFIEKGFSISEAFLIQKDFQSFHPTIEEIDRLIKDDLTNILKLEYVRPNLDNNHNFHYILVLGPAKRGKTTVIFNLINSLYNIHRDSLYRVQKNKRESNEYYDEYVIQISNKDFYFFVDFKGMGDIMLDCLGLDQSGKNNLFTAILQYAMNKPILAILYVNSSSINRLGYEEHYQLQRFFEILPRSFLNRIFFILTYCTDNQPLLNVYSSELNSSVPEEMKIMMRQPQTVPKENKFWFGINNAYLYEKIDYREQKEFKENNEIDIQSVIDGQKYLNVEIQREEGTLLEEVIFQDNHKEEFQEFEFPSQCYKTICYKNMFSISMQILEKFSSLSAAQSNESQLFGQVISFEEDILKLLQQNMQLNQIFQKRLILYEEKSNYLQVRIYVEQNTRDKTQQADYDIEYGFKSLFCSICGSICHYNCSLRTFSEIFLNQKICRRLIDNRVEPYADIEIQYKQIQCKSCLKRKQNCSLKFHKFYFQSPEKEATIWNIQLEAHQYFMNIFFQRKNSKKRLRLEQSTVFHLRSSYYKQINKIQDQLKQLNALDDRLTKINISRRTNVIDQIYKQSKDLVLTEGDFQVKLLNLKQIYDSIVYPFRKQFFNSDSVFLLDKFQHKPFDYQQFLKNSTEEFIQEVADREENQRDLVKYVANSNMKKFYDQNKKQKPQNQDPNENNI